MHYYHVWVASQRYHGHEPLTYASTDRLPAGTIVLVPLRAQNVSGIIVTSTTKPSFTAKPIVKVLVATPLPATSLRLLQWLSDYYPAPSGILTNQFLPAGLLLQQANVSQSPAAVIVSPKKKLPVLTDEQRAALERIRQVHPQTVLLHGATGSGKTRVYLELARENLAKSLHVLLLTPEIGLTSPLAQSFQSNLPYSTVVMHSNLTEKARREVWLKILEATKPMIVIGPRSALFSPFSNLGLIVIDEAHDNAYKQDQAPYYQAVRVAGHLARLHTAQLVLGTATPTIADYYVAEAKKLPIIRMQKQAVTSSVSTPHIEVVNIKNRDEFTRHPYLSNLLLTKIETALNQKEQSLVFLNRRGTARLVLCQVCGWQALCSNCDLPLTYHADKHVMRCHTCGFLSPAPSSCPTCSSTDIVFKSIGTKAVTDGLQRLFPNATVQRFDTDNLKDERFEAHYAKVAEGKVDILVGTQMLIKGHDLPQLSVVGVVAADSSLYFPDYTAEEQTYQLLTQVIGRVSRGHRAGTAVIQTYNPDNFTLKEVLAADWSAYYHNQLRERRQFGFPPFVQLLKLSCARPTSSAAQLACAKLLVDLRALNLPVQLLGPTPRFLERVGKKYRWQIVVKSKSRGPLLSIIKQLPANWTHDLDPTNLL